MKQISASLLCLLLSSSITVCGGAGTTAPYPTAPDGPSQQHPTQASALSAQKREKGFWDGFNYCQTFYYRDFSEYKNICLLPCAQSVSDEEWREYTSPYKYCSANPNESCGRITATLIDIPYRLSCCCLATYIVRRACYADEYPAPKTTFSLRSGYSR